MSSAPVPASGADNERGSSAPLHEALPVLIAARIRRLLGVNGIDPARVACRVEHGVAGLRVVLELPESVTASIERALSVRVLDAVGDLGQTVGRVAVSFEPPRPDWQ